MATEATRPPKLLSGTATFVDIVQLFLYDDGSGDPWLNGSYQFIYDLAVIEQLHSSHRHKSAFGATSYSGFDIRIGDWISTQNAARALRITALLKITADNVRVVVEDFERYNTMQDINTTGSAYIPDGSCLIFEVDENFLPTVYPLPSTLPDQINSTWPAEITSRFLGIRERRGIPVRQVAHGFALGQPLRVARSDEVVVTVAAGTNTAPTVTAGERAYINGTVFVWPTLTSSADIVAFLNDLNLGDGTISAFEVGGSIELRNDTGRDIVAWDFGAPGSLLFGLGISSSGSGVFPGKLVAAGDSTEAVAMVTSLGDTPDEFFLSWLGPITTLNQTIQGSVGDRLSGGAGGIFTINPSGPIVKLNATTATIVRGRSGAEVGSFSEFFLNKIYVSSDGTIDGTVAAINGLGVAELSAENVENSLQIVQSTGKDIVISDDYGTDVTEGFGIRNFTAGSKDRIVILSPLDTVPEPPALSSKMIEASGLSEYLLADGVPSNGPGTPPAAGIEVPMVVTDEITSTTAVAFGNGTSGTLVALINGVDAGSRVLTTGDDTGNYDALEITANPFYEGSNTVRSLTARVHATGALAGLNGMRLQHTATGQTNEAFVVYDDVAGTPTMTDHTAEEATANMVYSSGVPHYAEGSVLDLGVTANNLVGRTYPVGHVVELKLYPECGTTLQVAPGQGGLPDPLPQNSPPIAMTPLPFTISMALHGKAEFCTRARNSNGWGSFAQGPFKINVMSGAGTLTADGGDALMENAIYVAADLGTSPAGAAQHAGRITGPTGDTPILDLSTITDPDWDSEAELPAWEAAVVGGVARADRADYSIVLPAGPNFTGRDAVQYLTVMFRRAAVSKFGVVLTGDSAISGCWVRLPGVNTAPATNGWWDMFDTFTRMGVPGEIADGGNGSTGCALGVPMNGSSGTYICTFGQQSSSNSTNNIIAVRFRLEDTDRITGLAFVKV